MNRVLTIILSLLVCFVLLAGCGEGDSATSDNSTEPTGSMSSEDNTSSINSENSESSDNSTVSSGEISDTQSDPNENGENTDPTPDPEPDPNAPTVYLTATRDGNTVTVSFNVKNNPGLAAYTIKIGYNTAKLIPKAINATLSTPVTSNLQQPGAAPKGKITAVYANLTGVSKDGELFNITFDVAENAIGSAEFEIIADENDFVAPDYAYIQFQKQNTEISLD